MARKPRVHFPGAFYHVMLRGNGGMTIFEDDFDRKIFLDLVEETVKRFEYRVHAFCLMTNHVHFAIEVGGIPLSNIIQNISFRYTRYVNKKQQRIGHLFQGRYKALLVDEDNYLLQLVRYIHRNPMRANMVTSLDHYRWSSHSAYSGLEHSRWLTTSMIYNMLASSESAQVLRYRQFINNIDHESVVDFEVSMQKSFPAICDDRFMQRIADLRAQEIKKKSMTLTDLIAIVCAYYEIDSGELHSKMKSRNLSRARAAVAWLAVRYKITTLEEAANYFGRSGPALSQGMSRLVARLGVDGLSKLEGLVK